MQKGFWKSKTFWVNVAAFVAMALGSQEFNALLPSGWEDRAFEALAALNLILRFATKQPIVVQVAK